MVQFCEVLQKISTKSSCQKNIIFLKTQKNVEIQNFEPKTMTRLYVCLKISEYPPGEEAFTWKYVIWPLRSRSHKMLPSTIGIMWLMHLQSLKYCCYVKRLGGDAFRIKYIIWPCPSCSALCKCLHRCFMAVPLFKSWRRPKDNGDRNQLGAWLDSDLIIIPVSSDHFFNLLFIFANSLDADRACM